MDNVRISVIVAVYNREATIDRCIDSLVYQTFQDFEIVLVDDRSTDGSMEKMLEWQRLFPNKIRILVSEEKGVAYAKNTGIKAAKGDYLTFVDSDDWIDYKLFERLHNAIVDDKTEMVYSPYWKINGKCKSVFGALPKEELHTVKDYLQTENFCLPGRLIKRCLFDRFGLLPILCQGEDLGWLYKTISHMDSPSAFEYVGLAGYYYEIHQDSICAQFDDKSIIDDIVRGADYILETVASEYFDTALLFLLKRMTNLKSKRIAHTRVFDEWICNTLDKYPYIVESITSFWLKCELENARQLEIIPTTVFVNGFDKSYAAEELEGIKDSVFLADRKDIKIVELSENNCDINECLLVSEAYARQDYKFVGNYFAMKACYDNGGIFIDRDVQIDSVFNSLLKDPAFFGFESDDRFTDKVFGCQPGNPVFGRILQTYEMPELYEDEFAPLSSRIKTVLIGIGNVTMCSGIIKRPEYGFCVYPVDMFVYSLPYAENMHLCHYKPEAFANENGVSVPIQVLKSLSDRRMRLEGDKEKKSTKAVSKERDRYKGLAQRYKGLAQKRSDYIVKLEREREIMLHSWSWRVSKPVRVVGGIMRAIKKAISHK